MLPPFLRINRFPNRSIVGGRTQATHQSIHTTPYPAAAQLAHWANPAAERKVKLAQEVVACLRSMFASYGFKPSAKPTVYVRCKTADSHAVCTELLPEITKLANCEVAHVINEAAPAPADSGMRPVNDFMDGFVVLKGMIDVAKEISALEKKKAAHLKALETLEAKMAVPTYSKTPAAVQEQNTKKLATLKEELVGFDKAMEGMKKLL